MKSSLEEVANKRKATVKLVESVRMMQRQKAFERCYQCKHSIVVEDAIKGRLLECIKRRWGEKRFAMNMPIGECPDAKRYRATDCLSASAMEEYISLI